MEVPFEAMGHIWVGKYGEDDFGSDGTHLQTPTGPTENFLNSMTLQVSVSPKPLTTVKKSQKLV